MTIEEKKRKLVQYLEQDIEYNRKLCECVNGGTVDAKSWYDEFWDNFQENGKKIHYAYAFSFAGWNDNIYNPKYPIIVNNVNGIANMFFWNRGITDTKVHISNTGTMIAAFANSFIERIPSLEVNGVTDYSSAFLNCDRLKVLNLSGVIDINGFDIHWSTGLTADSLYSIIQALSTTTTGLTITLPTTAQANYNANPPEGAPATWAELVAARSNWTIAYA